MKLASIHQRSTVDNTETGERAELEFLGQAIPVPDWAIALLEKHCPGEYFRVPEDEAPQGPEIALQPSEPSGDTDERDNALDAPQEATEADAGKPKRAARRE